MNNNPLVSVSVVAYNSSKYIVEVLDGVYNQTYQNLELVISDDCSKDNTVELCREWIASHSDRFVRVELLEAEVNQGVCANGNRAIGACRGEWIKGIAGDDALPTDSIQEYVNYVSANPDCEICFAKLRPFGINEEANAANERVLEGMYKGIKLPTKERQYRAALRSHILPGTGLFFRREFFHRVGGFNPKYRNTEEYDFELRAFQEAHVEFIDKFLYNWRIREDSLCHSNEDKILDDEVKFFNEVLKKRQKKEGMYLYMFDTKLKLKSRELKKNNNILLAKCIKLISPFYYARKIFSLRRYVKKLSQYIMESLD
jgi:glycosyltransferase involved in cell wall biosynthesis